MTDPVSRLDQRIQAATELEGTSRTERKAIIKEALREAIKEWLDERVLEVGKWSLRGIGLAAFAALVFFILTHSGWKQ